MNSKKLNISLGVMAPSISEQLKAQGFKHDFRICKSFNALDDCAARLHFAGLISETERKRVADKLFKLIAKHVKSYGRP